MAHFSYTAEKSDGEIYKGFAAAPDRFALYDIVRHEGGRILSVDEDRDRSIWNLAYWNVKLASVREYDKVLLARNLGAMLSAGLSLSRALAVLDRQTKNARLASVVAEVASDVRRGTTLHESLAKFPRVFSRLMVAMVRAGEESGDLPAALMLTSDQMERMYNLKKKIRGALLYPAIIVVSIIGIGVVMMIEVVPTLAQTFAEMNAELPQSTQLVIGFSNFLIKYTFLAVVLAIGAVVAAVALLRTSFGRRGADWVALHLPLIGTMVKELNSARTARTLASLSSSGVDILTALEITREVVQNSYYREALAKAQTNVRSGQPLSATFVHHEKLYPPFVGEMMAVGEETGATAEMLKRLAGFYEDEVERKTKDMSTIIEPFLMVFIGGAVGFFAVAMISPIYQLSEHI